MRRSPGQFVLLLLVLLASIPARAAISPTVRPGSTNNDDSCDLAVLPAATLLLPFFEVQVDAPASIAETTIFTIVNTGREPQIAHVTLWTDYGQPVLVFNLFLTGYDAEAVNLYDVLVRGMLTRQSSLTKRPGSRSADNNGNQHFLPSAAEDCSILGRTIPPAILAEVRSSLTTGRSTECGDAKVGGTHPSFARGYATIDVVATCTNRTPLEAGFFNELLYDNVLTGDYQRISPNPSSGNYAGGASMVHLRAMPEGGPAAALVATNLPYTFYDLYTPAVNRRRDRRQPLPSTFAARFVEGGPTSFLTNLHIWREPVAAAHSFCSVAANAHVPFVHAVRFDERENPSTMAASLPVLGVGDDPELPPASRVATHETDFFPPRVSDEVAGWLYLNLSNGGSPEYSTATGRDLRTSSSTERGARQSQNWVTVSMYAEGRYSVMFDATMLANGCSISPARHEPIGPGENATR